MCKIVSVSKDAFRRHFGRGVVAALPQVCMAVFQIKTDVLLLGMVGTAPAFQKRGSRMLNTGGP